MGTIPLAVLAGMGAASVSVWTLTVERVQSTHPNALPEGYCQVRAAHHVRR